MGVMPIITETTVELDFARFEEQAGHRLQHDTVRRAAHWAVDEAERLSLILP